MTHDITAGLQAYIAREIREAERRTLKVTMEVVGETAHRVRSRDRQTPYRRRNAAPAAPAGAVFNTLPGVLFCLQ